MTQRRIYQWAFPYHITFNISYREWFFEEQERAKILHEIILNAGDIKNHIVYQFCIMPDHVHILCKTEWEDSTQRRLEDSTQRRLEDSTQRRLEDSTQRRLEDGTQRRLENLHCVGDADCVGGLGMKDTPVFRSEGFPTCDVKNTDNLPTCDVKNTDNLPTCDVKNTDIPTTCDVNSHNISDFIKSIKGTFSRTIHMGRIWQPRFHDEIIETDDQLLNTIPYITNNPIEAELPEKWNFYPYQYKNDELIDGLIR